MGEFNAEVFCVKLEAIVKNIEHRIDELEKTAENNTEMLIAIKEIATEMKGMKKTQDNMDNRLKEIEKKPALTLDKIFGTIIVVVVTAAVTQMLTK